MMEYIHCIYSKYAPRMMLASFIGRALVNLIGPTKVALVAILHNARQATIKCSMGYWNIFFVAVY